MSGELTQSPQYRSTIDQLERLKRTTADGEDYWLARDINITLGYPNWREFEALMERAGESLQTERHRPVHTILC